MPLPLRSVPYFAPFALAVFGEPALVPMYASTAIVSWMLMLWFRVPDASEGSSAGAGTSKKSHGFEGSRSPPATWFVPSSRASLQPSASASGAPCVVTVAALHAAVTLTVGLQLASSWLAVWSKMLTLARLSTDPLEPPTTPNVTLAIVSAIVASAPFVGPELVQLMRAALCAPATMAPTGSGGVQENVRPLLSRNA